MVNMYMFFGTVFKHIKCVNLHVIIHSFLFQIIKTVVSNNFKGVILCVCTLIFTGVAFLSLYRTSALISY